jgi:hypothetical protein
MQNLYGAADAASMTGAVVRNFGLYSSIGMEELNDQLPKLFHTDLKTNALLFRDAGYQPDRIAGWLRRLPPVRDDGLASVLGSAHPGDLGFDCQTTIYILKQLGYDVPGIYKWLKADKYYLDQIADDIEMVGSRLEILSALKKAGISRDEITTLDLHIYTGLSKDKPVELWYKWVMEDLVNVGFSVKDGIQAYLTIGGSVLQLPSDLWSASVNYSLNYNGNWYGNNPFKAQSAADIAAMEYNALVESKLFNVTMVDIARGFLISPDFDKVDVLRGINRVTGNYLQAAGITYDSKENLGATLNILRLAGQSARDSAKVLLHYNVHSWTDAMVDLYVAGYSSGDVTEALFTTDYAADIAGNVLSILFQLGQLASDPGYGNLIKSIGKFAKVGWSIGSAYHTNGQI